MTKRQEPTRLTAKQQALAADNLNLARNIAWKYHRSTSIEYSFLESVAFEGLCQAAGRYDPTILNEETGKSMRFSSLAVPYIRGSILHYIRDKTYSLKLTHLMRENWVKGRRLLNRGLSDYEISQELGISMKDWQDTRSVCSGPPLELKDQACPSLSMEPEEIDRLAPFRGLAAEKISRMSTSEKNKMERYLKIKAAEPTATVLGLFRSLDLHG